MSKENIIQNNLINNNSTKDKSNKKSKKVSTLIVSLIIIVAVVIGFLIKTYAYQYRFTHKSDKIDMSNNSITYEYYDNEEENGSQKTYTISDNWIGNMIIRNQPLDNDWDSNPIATDTTIYGPYTWLPAGKYTITFDFTDGGGTRFQYWDVGVNFGNGNCGPQQYYASYSKDDPLIVGSNGATIYNSKYWRDSSGPHLQYTIDTTGDTADYEFRLLFSDSYGNDIPFTGTADMDIKTDFITSVRIKAESPNKITLNANGGTVTDSTVDTYWGEARPTLSSSQIPKREGYTFDGYYGYSQATNTTSERKGLKFNTSSPEIKIWNSDGKPAISTEVSYNDYTVYAHWKPNKHLEVNWDSGVSYVKGKDINGNEITLNEGDSYEYHYNYVAPTYIYIKEGYTLDYISEEISSGSDRRWDDSTYNSTLSRWENSWTMNNDRTIYIHTKRDLAYGSLTLDWDEGVEKVIDADDSTSFTKGLTKLYKLGTNITYKFKVNNGYELDYISEGSTRYEASEITRLNNDADGSPLRYTVTSANTKYVDIKRKQYAISFNKGLTNSTAIMPSVSLVAGSSYKVPTPEWLGRSYTITLNEDTQFIANWDTKDICINTGFIIS